MGFAPAVGAAGCGSGPEGGAIDLQAFLLEDWQAFGAASLGIFNCRRTGGPGSPWSIHAEGRALDLGVGVGHKALGDQVLEQLLAAHGEALQRVIWWRRIYDLASPEGRPYAGQSPHEDHVHIELSWAAARRQIPLGLLHRAEEDEDPMPTLVVAYKGAQWAVSADLTSRVGLAQGVDVRALLSVAGGRAYAPAVLSEGLMERIPEVSALS